MLNRIWYSDSKLKWLLWPFSLVYQAVIAVRSFLYRLGLLKSVSFEVPVIVVGNITVGGTGKTPFCVALCELLKKQGLRPGLVSRGYGGQATSWPQVVTMESDPLLVGDEPVLLVRHTKCPMVVAPNRVAAVQKLLADYDCNIIISDDGLQHYHLGRDLEIVLLNKNQGMGNGLCLPAGPLRESVNRLKTVDFVVSNDQLVIEFNPVYSLSDPHKIIQPNDVSNRKVCAVAGIANPDRFFNALTALGFIFERHIFKDHYFYEPADLAALKADIILMTEKDAVKCRTFCDNRCYVLPMVITLRDEFSQALLDKLQLFSSAKD